jgi:beta-1,4-mannosyl-glycoprotein beta-1,4-N-acetylglucosaminyltransferase
MFKISTIWPRLLSTRRRTRFVDACILYNEIDLLKLRLEELWDQVDFFVVVEADSTFAGQSKPYFFLDHRAQFRPYKDKLIYRAIANLPPIPRPDEEARWLRESVQRGAITGVISELNLSPNDIVVLSDVDEIPRPDRVERLPQFLIELEYAIFVQANFRGYVNNASSAALNGANWTGSVASRVRTFLREGAQQIRYGNNKSGRILVNRSTDYCYIDGGGWHFSSFGGPEAFWLKAANFSHIDDPYRIIRLGESVPEQRVFSANLDREQCRSLQQRYLDHCTDPVFSPLEFDAFEVHQDIPKFLRREKEKFRGYFFFTDLVHQPHETTHRRT